MNAGIVQKSAVPKHVAIIMDGNGRWAKKRMLPRSLGHQQGVKSVRLVVQECRKLGIEYLTLYAFSSENWNRPESEVGFLMGLFDKYLQSELNDLIDNDIRVRIMGERSKLSENVNKTFRQAEDRSRNCKSLTLNLAISYGSRTEIVQAVQNIVKSGIAPEKITEQTISENLYMPDIPDPDLLIRTSSEYRISNFLLWQSAYTEFVFSDLLWPDFGAEDFNKCIEQYMNRERRFGCTSEQVVSK